VKRDTTKQKMMNLANEHALDIRDMLAEYLSYENWKELYCGFSRVVDVEVENKIDADLRFKRQKLRH
jgi:hypothetical protein